MYKISTKRLLLNLDAECALIKSKTDTKTFTAKVTDLVSGRTKTLELKSATVAPVCKLRYTISLKIPANLNGHWRPPPRLAGRGGG